MFPGLRLREDIVAGLVTAAVVIPKAMAYATIAGLPVEVGLYTVLVPMAVYAFLGSSRPLSVSTTTTIAILAGAELAEVVPNGDPAQLLTATATLTLLVGIALILAAVLRLGFVASFISTPVLVGFKAGIAVVIIVDQVPKLLGLHFEKGGFLHNIGQIVQGLGHLSWPTFAVGLGTIVLLTTLEHVRPRWPAPLIAVGAAIACAGFFAWNRFGIDLVGAIPSGLPHITLPQFSLVQALWPAALGIALMSFTETIAVARAFQGQDEPPPRPNRELIATGAGNAIGALLGGMPAGGGMSQTAVNRSAGAKSQASGLTTAITALVTMLWLAPLIGLMPQATLAGLVMVYSVGLFKLKDFRDILRIRRAEFIWAIVAFAGVILLGTLKGIIVAIIVSLVALSQQATNPRVYVLRRKRGTNVFRPMSEEHPDDESFPGLLIVRPEGRLFFLNTDRLAERLQMLVAEFHPKTIVLDMASVFDIEYSALQALIAGERRLREAGIQVVLVGLAPEALEMVRRSPLDETLGEGRMFFNLEMAVRHLAPTESSP